MSSGNTGPYQSRLLNFISRQSRQVTDRCDRTWRKVRLTTLNATQILLYPVYLIVQSSRMLGRQLRESSKKVDLPELQEFVGEENPNLSENWLEMEIEGESAIDEVLHIAENLLLPSQISTVTESFSFLINPPKPTAKVAADMQLQPERQLSGKIATTQKITGETPVSQSQEKSANLSLFKKASALESHLNTAAEIANKPQVRGIASFIPARTLVLVGTSNQILDILTPEQQQLLEGRIIWEVANSGPQRREIAEKELKFNLGLESAARTSQLPPVRGFWQLMTWVQSSPVAVKRNQFGESIFAVKKAINASVNDNLILAQKARDQIAGLKVDRQAIATANSMDQNTLELETSFNGKFDRAANIISFVTLVDRAAANLEEFSLQPVSKITAALTENQPSKILDPASPNTNLGPSAREILENYARNIEKMIWSSVDQLLGKETAASDNTEKAVAIQYYLEQQNKRDTEKVESDRPWLNWQDLFGEPAPAPIVGAVPPCPPSPGQGAVSPGEPAPAPIVGAVPPCPPSPGQGAVPLGPPSPAQGAVSPGPPSPAQEHISQLSTKVNHESKEIETLPEGRSVNLSTSPYPEAIQALVAQLKRSLLTKVKKSQPQKGSDLTITQKKNSVVAATGTQKQKPTAPNNAQISHSPAVTTVETSRFVATSTTASALEPQNNSADTKQEGDYLETKAVSAGYIKHPLEQVLEWLDQIMLRLETIAVEIWEWAKINLPKIKNSKDKID
ncbi:MAG TPA: hypothetical protein DD001_18315 [Microcoleaceae bacterium UBA10368]|nr:hypothetical protein [Microcoleaceae cyanobacterium UBA10368]HCV30408.1 hypothetical protein [Microcoleaceae cyanobacterium UBA9251]